MSDFINKSDLLEELLKLPGVGSNSNAIDLIKRFRTVKLENLDSAIDEIERVLVGNKGRDVEEVYLQNAIRLIKDTKKKSIFGMDYMTDKTMHNLNVDRTTAIKLVYLAYERSIESYGNLYDEINKLDDEDVMDIREQQINIR